MSGRLASIINSFVGAGGRLRKDDDDDGQAKSTPRGEHRMHHPAGVGGESEAACRVDSSSARQHLVVSVSPLGRPA
jgi:hypothetical protein